MSDVAGQRLGKYEIIEPIGRGGFATVYRALDTTLDREVALKVLHPQLLADARFVARFKREAEALAQLRHPHIIAAYEVSEADERLYIAMGLAHGPNLGQVIEQRGRIPWAEVLDLLDPICGALDYAHEHGTVHRDLKPSNILLDEERGPLLSDFGFARLMGASSVSLSLSGGILGTPSYIAPEVWELDAAEAATDIYALGCIVYEMLTGNVLFKGRTPMQVMHAHDRGPQLPESWPEGVPIGIEEVLGKALARDYRNRYPESSALRYALGDLEGAAQSRREMAEQAAVAAQWRAETEAAMACGEWSAARMAVGRWLAVAPDDADALQARVTADQHLAKQTGRRAGQAGRRAEQKVSRPLKPSRTHAELWSDIMSALNRAIVILQAVFLVAFSLVGGVLPNTLLDSLIQMLASVRAALLLGWPRSYILFLLLDIGLVFLLTIMVGLQVKYTRGKPEQQ